MIKSTPARWRLFRQPRPATPDQIRISPLPRVSGSAQTPEQLESIMKQFLRQGNVEKFYRVLVAEYWIVRVALGGSL
jgi:hypothetical protein